MSTVHPALLAGRTAACSCGKSMSSSAATSQPFFSYRGPGTCDDQCSECGYRQVAHEYDESRRSPEPVPATLDHEFTPRLEGFPTDTFYCGDYDMHPAGLD